MNKAGVVAAAVVIAAGAVGAWWTGCRERQQTRTDVIERAAIHAADSAKVEAVQQLHQVRQHTDSVLAAAPPILPKPVVKVLIDDERRACDSTIAAGDRQVATRARRITTLEKRSSPHLSLYAEAGFSAKLLVPRPTLRPEVEVGIEVQLSPTTELRAGVTTEQEVKVGVEKHLHLF